MLDVREETLITFAEAAKHLPIRRGGKKVAVSTLYRWAKDGVRGVILESLQCGGTLCTSLPALQRFFARLSAQRSRVPLTTPSVQPDVEVALDREGL
ncbi:MAG TPA: DUF1580 domain-containing protein [Planctomycetaceae bacterium]|jgi:hypothetical protein|nr:DUF1580 domain-containing protein [Planctomycetaceae bacterium]